MIRKVLLYGLPIYLYALDLFVRTIGHLPGEGVVGPSLASAGIAFLLPLMKLKAITLDPQLAQVVKATNGIVHSPRDEKFSEFVLLLFLVSLLAWMFSIYCATNPPHMLHFNTSLSIGCFIFVASVVCSEIKERL